MSHGFFEERGQARIACSAGVLSLSGQFARESATSRSEEEMGRVILSPSHLIFLCHKINDGGYNNITNTNNVSPTQNTPALQAKARQVIKSNNWLSLFILDNRK